MKIVSVVGARPQFIKLAPIDWALRDAGHTHRILHTGQHYDPSMSGDIFHDLGIADPTWNLEVGSESHGAQTAAMLVGCERILDAERPDWVLCFGDTNSTLAGALAATKLLIPTAHVEAGLRSFNRAMPEEQNRIVADHVSDLLLAPTDDAMAQLEREGLAARSRLVGDVMVDAIRSVDDGEPPEPRDAPYLVATIHRAENTDDAVRLRAVIEGLARIPAPVILYAHPRLRRRADDVGLSLSQGGVEVRSPIDYRGLMRMVRNAQGVVTDSGGLQKEAYLLEAPCTTVRPETEWVETLVDGWNQLVEPDELPTIAVRPRPERHDPNLFGDGKSAERIVEELGASGATGR